MAMSAGGSTGRKAEINVTPLIDVLLVLLIIFMVVLPPNSHGLSARIPEPAPVEPASTQTAPNVDVVITVQANRTVRLNQEAVAIEDLSARLKALFTSTVSWIVFVRADKDLEFQQIAEVIDIARGAGLDRFALMTQ